MTAFLSPIGTSGIPFFTQQGVVLAGGQLFTYLAGTTTPQATWTTPGQVVQNPNPIILNSAGLSPQEIWLQQGFQYKFVLTDSNGNVLSTYDNISGINDSSSSSSSSSEWILLGVTPTYVSANSFTVPGNQTAVLQSGRRIQVTVASGVVYGTIVTSVFATVTTVTVLLDSSALDAGLSSVSYGFLNSLNPSFPKSLVNVQNFPSSGTYTPTPGATFAIVELMGAGGAGGGTVSTTTGQAASACGGGAGAYGKGIIAGQLSPQTVTIGAAGTGVSGSSGNSGGATSLGSIFIATGGQGGNAAAAATPPASVAGGAAGGACSGSGTFIVAGRGQAGTPGYTLSTGSVINGQGGSSMWGSGGNGNSASGLGFGAGGAGNGVGQNVAAGAGFPGAPGYLIIYEFA